MRRYSIFIILMALMAICVGVQAASSIINDTSNLQVNVKVSNEKGYIVNYIESGIYNTPRESQTGEIEIQAKSGSGEELKIESVKLSLKKDSTPGVNYSLGDIILTKNPKTIKTLDWNGEGKYVIKVTTKNNLSSIISIDIKSYTSTTSKIRYRTTGLTVREIYDKNGDKSLFFDPRTVAGGVVKLPELMVRLSDGLISGNDWNKIASQDGVVCDGRYYIVRGSGIFESYNFPEGTLRHGPFYPDKSEILVDPLPIYTKINPDNEKNYFKGQLLALINCEYWTDSTSYRDFPDKCHMELDFRAPKKGIVIINKKLKKGESLVDYEGGEEKVSYVNKRAQALGEIHKGDSGFKKISKFSEKDDDLAYIYENIENTVKIDERDDTPSGYKLSTTESTIEYGTGVSGAVTSFSNRNKIAWSTPSKGIKSEIFEVNQTFQRPNIKITLVYAQDPPTEGRFGIDAKPDTVQVVHTDKIRSTASISAEMKQSADSLARWKEFTTGKTLQLSVNLSRIPQNNAPPSTSSITTASGYPANGTFVNISRDQLLSYFEKGKTILYNDTINYSPIAEGQTVKFDYTAVVKLKVDSQTFTLRQDPGTDSVSFFRPYDAGTYTSTPSCWSEIKEGSPGNETFEAMAGVPTTRSLYFASGGSEFIVDVEAEYVHDTTATRTYKVNYSGTDCEFKVGDTAVMGDQTHSFSETRDQESGTIPIHGAAPAQKAASPKKYSWTAASDGIKREVTETATSNQSITEPKCGCPGHSHTESVSDGKGGTTTKTVTDPCPKGGHCLDATGSYRYSWTYSVPAHAICGPECQHVMPAITDTWSQKVIFDHMKINKVRVWKIDQAAVNGMQEITGIEGDIKASIVQGNPNIFYNIAAERNPGNPNSSRGGRLRYSIETDQHDTVVWNEGVRTNKCNNQAQDWGTGILYTNNAYTTMKDYHKSNATEKDKKTAEFARFDMHRTTQNVVSVISDMLILQTSSGDQSVIYFSKDSESRQTQEDFPKVAATKQDIWDANPLSAAKWKENQINIGSYNGNFAAPLSKYTGTGNHSLVATAYDTKPAGINRPSRPSTGLRLVQTGIDIIDTLPNGEYITGDSSVFYKLILNYGTGSTPYSTSNNARYGDTGYEKESPYSNNHTKVNNIVIHDPVSTEAAVVMPLPSDRDQRTPETKVLGGNLQPGEVEYESMLKANPPKQNLLYNGDAELTSSDGGISGWTKGEWGASGTYTHARRTNDPTWTISGTGSFEIRSNKNEPAGSSASYYMDLTGIPMNNRYTLSGKIAAHRCTVTLELSFFDPSGALISSAQAGITNNNSVPLNVSYPFTPPANAYRMRVEMRKGVTTSGTTDSYLFVDNLSLINNDVNTWIALSDPIYDTVAVPNPDYSPAQQGVTVDFNYTGAQQTFTAPYTGTYTLEVWGAQGGDASSYRGGYGGYAKGDISLNSGQTIYIYVGEAGHAPSSGAAWNGGGSGTCCGGGGGGATDIRLGGTAITNRIIVAGGGGGASLDTPAGNGGAGGGASGESGNVGAGGTQTSGYALGQGASNSYDTAGGGGGYYGGLDGGGGTGGSGGGGSGYIGGVTNATMSSGVRPGNGFAKITAPNSPAVGSPTITVQVLAANQPSSVPPDDWYELVARTTSPTAQITVPDVGSVSAGTFINLDHPFYVSFPNLGNFRGDGSWGIAGTTAQRGKGFIDGMDTTEYTRSKSVTFAFNVLYNGTVYPAGQEIDLPVAEQLFEFYCPLANFEALSASVTFKAIAINGSVMDNTNMTNRLRDAAMSAKHSAIKNCNVDIVGRIGNLTIEDTGDFRFSNFFKLPVAGNEWIVPNVVKKVDPKAPNKIIGSGFDIKGNPVGEGTDYLNTYGHLEYLQQPPVDFPLSPEKNNIPALQKQPMRPGYNVFASIQTIGNYYTNLQVKMYYYHLNLTTKLITPVDVYMSINNSYKPINLFDEPAGRDLSSLYPYKYNLNWEEEKDRRNYSEMEDMITKMASLAYGLSYPSGNNCIIGTAQVLQLGSSCRTFIGNSSTYGQYKNPGEVLPLSLFNVQAQRWHFTYGLPSSAVFVPKGTAQPTQAIIDSLCNNKSVIIAAAEIKVTGNPYVLKYLHMEGNSDIVINGQHYPTASIPYTVLSVYSANKSSADDLTVTGTH